MRASPCWPTTCRCRSSADVPAVELADPAAFYSHVWVLKSDGLVVGSAALTAARGGVTTLKRMYLRPQLRGQGWGRLLLNTAIQAAASNGCRRIELDTSERQVRARRLYEAAGFAIQRRDGENCLYAKTLTAGCAPVRPAKKGQSESLVAGEPVSSPREPMSVDWAGGLHGGDRSGSSW